MRESLRRELEDKHVEFPETAALIQELTPQRRDDLRSLRDVCERRLPAWKPPRGER